MKKHTKKLILMTVISLSLAACGKVDYTGTYSGTETQANGTSAYGGSNTATVSNVSLALSQSGNQLVGNYTNTPTTNNNYGSNTSTAAVTGQFIASVDKSNINNASLTIASSQYGYNGSYGSTCAGQYTGTLSGSSDAQMITGTLTSSTNSSCGQVNKTLILRKQ